MKSEAVPNFFLLFDYPQYSNDKLHPNKYQKNVDKQTGKYQQRQKQNDKQGASNILSNMQKNQKQYGNNIFHKDTIDKKKEQQKSIPPILLDQSTVDHQSYDAIIKKMESAESQFGQRCDLSLRGRVYPSTSSITDKMYSLIPQMK